MSGPTKPGTTSYTFVGESRGPKGWKKSMRYARATTDREAVLLHNTFPAFRTEWIGEGHRTVWRKP